LVVEPNRRSAELLDVADRAQRSAGRLGGCHPLAAALVRARNIKPSLFKNEVLGTADPLLTILFEGLWCEADREGRLEDRPLRLKAEILPYRNDADIDAMLTWLKDHGFIARYDANGLKVIQVLKFSDHQRPHNNEAESVLPTMDASKHNQGRKPAQPRKKALRSDSLLLIPDSGSLIPDPLMGREVRAARSTLATRLPPDFGLTPERRSVAEAEKADPDREFAQFTDHFRAAPGVKGRKNDWDATWRNWCRRAPDFKPHVNGRAADVPERTWRPPPDEDEHAGK
jgi:hypothetical protein